MQPKTYIIRTGEQFRDGDKILVGGDPIVLDDDMAKLHAGKIDPAPEPQASTAEAPTQAPAEAPQAGPTAETPPAPDAPQD